MNQDRIIFTKFSELSREELAIIADSWANPFNARYNYMQNPSGAVNELCNQKEPTFNNLNDYNDCMFFRVVRNKKTGEIVGTCRYGKHYLSNNKGVWDFGFNILLKHWGEALGVEVITKIIEIARENGVYKIIGGADKENFASYKAMIRNGFVFDCIDADGDYKYVLDVSLPPKSEEEINAVWNKHMEMAKKDFGEDFIKRSQLINSKIKEMVLRLKNCENEKELINKYFEELNNVEEFKFS